MPCKRYLMLMPAALLAACGVDPNDTLATVRLTEKSEMDAIAADDLDGLMRKYQDDAVLVSPNGASAVGIAAIRAAFAEVLADPGLKMELQPGPAWAAESGDLAVTTATIRFTTSEEATGAAAMTVANQTTWRRDSGATWKIVANHNTALPGPALVATTE